eukprot:scaffold23763_cov55-Attheya_sp.AAC.2
MSHNVVPMKLTTPPAAAISHAKESITVPVHNNSDNMSPQHGSTATGVASPASASVPRPVKPSLKQNPRMVPGGNGVRNTSSKDHIQWDEHAIEEHDLLRGTRMKATTATNNSLVQYNERERDPYSIVVWMGWCNGHSGEALDVQWDSLNTKLEYVAASQLNSSSASVTSQLSHEEEEAEHRKEAEFKNHRKQHYNEMDAVRRYKMEHPNMSDEDDDDDDDDDVEMKK